MSVRSGDAPGLNGLGVTDIEEEIYRVLLMIEGGSVANLREATGLTERKIRQALAGLGAKGLVARSAHRRGDYLVPASPEAAVEMLIMRKQDELNDIRLAARRLVDDLGRAARRSDASELVELHTAGEGLITRNDQLLMSAQKEILAFTVPPLTVPDRTFVDFKIAILGRGVKGRVVYAPTTLELPGIVEFIEAVYPAGEEPRVAAEVPMSLLVIDRRVGWVPALPGRGGASHDYLMVHPSSLLDALVHMFEAVWEGALPFQPGAMARANSDRADPLTTDDKRVLTLMTAGMHDAAIGVQMGVTLRTVQRHVRHIMEVLGTKTRFQAGVAACRRGFTGVSGDDDEASQRWDP